MKHIKRYTKSKTEKHTPTETITVSLPSRYVIAMGDLFDIHPDLKEIEAGLKTPRDGSRFYFHESDLKVLYDKYRDGEITIAYIRKWLRLFNMVSGDIYVDTDDDYNYTVIELTKLEKKNQLNRKNFLAVCKKLFNRITEAEPLYFVDPETGEYEEVQYDQPAKVLPLVPRPKRKATRKTE